MYALGATALSAALLLASPADAFFKLVCPGRIVDERADPIISPGKVSGHVHNIAGGSGFSFDMTYEDARASSCTSCPITADLSNYWTPALYFHASNGSFIKVPEVGDGPGTMSGMNVYYQQRMTSANGKALQAFPEGFRMVAGDPFKRNATSDLASKAISYVCLDYAGGGPPQGAAFPTVNCPDGLRAQVYFPSCWDGVNLDSADHKSHMSYPLGENYDNGVCPDSHPQGLISIFYEVLYNVDMFSGERTTGDQPFVWAMGDPTGYGFHGDFVNGWDVDVLQDAVTNCNIPGDAVGDINVCSAFDGYVQEDADAHWCQVPVQVDEDILGPLSQLPGCNPVTDGPGEAAIITDCAVTPISAPEIAFVDLTVSEKYKYIGCGQDSISDRALSGPNENVADMTLESCVKFCKTGGYTYAGAEYGTQCYCGNDLSTAGVPKAGILGACAMPCGGDATEICGGAAAMSIYEACGSGSCTNAVFAGASGNGTTSSKSSGGSAASSVASSASSAASSVASAGSSAVSSVASAASSAASSAAASSSASATTAGNIVVASSSSSSSSSSPTTTPKTTSHSSSVAITSTVTSAVTATSTNDSGDVIVYVTVTDYVTVTEVPVASATPNKKRNHKHGVRHDF